MPTRNVVLTDHHEELLERLVASGRYQNASEVLREGLRLVESKEAEEAAKLKALQDAVTIGIADLEAGRSQRFQSYEEMEAYLTAVTDAALDGKQDVARDGRRGGHFLMFRVASDDEQEIEVVRILHDHMDLAHHISPEA